VSWVRVRITTTRQEPRVWSVAPAVAAAAPAAAAPAAALRVAEGCQQVPREREAAAGVSCATQSWVGWCSGVRETLRVRRRGSCRLRVDPYSAAISPAASLYKQFPELPTPPLR